MFKYIRKLIPLILILIIVQIAANYYDISINFVLKDIIDNTIDGNMSDFTKNTISIMTYITISVLIYILFDFLRALFLKQAAVSIRSKYLKKIFGKNVNEFQSENNAKYMSILTNDYDLIETNYLIPLMEILWSVVTIGAGIYVFTVVDPIILLVFGGLMILNTFVSMVGSKPVNKHNQERSKMLGNYTGYIKEVLSAFHIIKTNDLQVKIRNDYAEKSKEVQHKGFIVDKIHSFIFALQNTNFMITFIGSFLFISYWAITGRITFGALILITQTTDKLVWPVANITQNLPKLMSVKSIVRRMEQSLENKYTYEETVDFNSFNNDIIFNDVSFSYDDNHVLEKVNLSFEKGKKYLIVGPSGGGKSTVLRLLRKYFNPQEGEILVDGIPLKDIKKEQYFNNIANIEQNVFLFEDTIRNNLTLYKDYADEQIYDALHRAGLDDFIKALPQGIETIIYDNGKNISGGERSRIAIARGLLNNSQIIFLDEAFASLDYERASEIERSILDLDNVTVINVSHVIIKENKHDYDHIFVVNKKKALELVSEE